MISIITISKNNVNGLRNTIESVQKQSSNAIEFIVVDGNSTDGSKQLLKDYSDCITISVSEADSGIYNAMNKGIKLATGDYLLFLNSGDYLLNNDVIKNIEAHLHPFDVVSGDLIIEDDKEKQHKLESKDEIDLSFFLNLSLYHQATFISKKMFENYGLYDESFKLGGDYEFFIRIFYKHNANYKHIKTVISYFKTDGISNNPAYAELNSAEAKRAWATNVSERSMEIMKTFQALKESEVYWLFIKEKTSDHYRRLFSILSRIRNKLNGTSN
jgi:glycosyltransferase involved in cell wall biosynthesis